MNLLKVCTHGLALKTSIPKTCITCWQDCTGTLLKKFVTKSGRETSISVHTFGFMLMQGIILPSTSAFCILYGMLLLLAGGASGRVLSLFRFTLFNNDRPLVILLRSSDTLLDWVLVDWWAGCWLTSCADVLFTP